MVELCSTFDVVALENGFVAGSCFVASVGVVAAAVVGAGVGDSGIVDGVAGAGGGDGGEGPHPPRSTYRTINTYLEMSVFNPHSPYLFIIPVFQNGRFTS